jgi:hypothetical protein
MENKIHFIEPLLERVEEYGKTSFELFKLNAVDKTAAVVSTSVSRGLAILVLFMFLLIANIGLSLWLGCLLGRVYYGFFVVAGFYGIIGVVLYFFMHNKIKKRVGDSIILQLLN